jgi:hypothetical protein
MGNEEALCEALIRSLEVELGGARSDISHPELDESGPPVEIRLKIGGRAIAIEHTLVEPFPGAIQTGKEFVELTAEIEAELKGKLPKPGTYVLLFPVHPTAGHHRRTHASLRAKIVEWVLAAAGELHAECPERRGRDARPHGFDGRRSVESKTSPHTLSLRVHWSESGRHDGALFLARAAGEDIEEQRLARMRTALAKKLPKLRECREMGDTTFLILEWLDIALSNQVVIATSLESALSERADWPDHILLADTATDQWHFFQPMVDGVFDIDME